MVVKMSELSSIPDSSSYAPSLQGYKQNKKNLYTYTSKITQLVFQTGIQKDFIFSMDGEELPDLAVY